jgi:uncharacterized protein YqeY
MKTCMKSGDKVRRGVIRLMLAAIKQREVDDRIEMDDPSVLGVLAETRKREFYEKPTQERKRKAAAAVKRQARRSSRDVTKRQRLY